MRRVSIFIKKLRSALIMGKRSRTNNQSPKRTSSVPHFFRTAKGKKEIEVHSLDFDGCFGPSYEGSGKYKSMAKHNKGFVRSLVDKHEDSNVAELKFMVGSSRQSTVSELQAMMQQHQWGVEFSGSCFVEMEAFVTDLNELFAESKIDISLDKFLMTDIFHQCALGNTFSQFVRENGNYLSTIYRDNMQKLSSIVPDLYEQANSMYAYICDIGMAYQIFFDEGKFTLLLTQMHKIASENPEADINFYFHEDRKDILTPLCAIFNTHPTLLPYNVTFHPHLHKLGKAKMHSYLAGPIKGTGAIDNDYKNTAAELKKMALDLTHPVHEKLFFVTDNLAARFIEVKELEKGITQLTSTPLLLKFIETRNRRLCLQETARVGVHC